jgi:ubiquinone/menaquinone biosynthesis C-methylase UbiE
MRRFMNFLYHLLYHPLAFTYDLVAWVVSFGKWNDWVLGIFPHLEGTRILELGHGPGHLQRFLLDRGLSPVALDESAPMGRLAKRRLGAKHKLTRGLAQSLPFPADSFDTVVSTFPSEYIFDPRTLAEIRRALKNGGRLVVLPLAIPSNGLLNWLYRVTGESPAALDEAVKTRLIQPFTQAGFVVNVETLDLKSSRLVILVAQA